MKNLKKTGYGLIRGQAGQALILVLVFFLLGSLTLTPVLMHMATALKTETKYELGTNELFTADAGIETGLWRIKYDYMGPGYDPYDFSTVWPYETDEVNGISADVLVQNVWMPSNVTLADLDLNSADARQIIESEKLVVTGTSGAIPGQPFHIKMEFHPDTGDNLTVKSIGVWLPQGFTYTDNSSELEALDLSDPCYPDSVNVSTVPGGTAVVWHFDDNTVYPLFSDFPNLVTENGTMTVTFQFEYSAPVDNPNLLPLAVTWVTCEMHDEYGNSAADPNAVENVPISWDTDTRYYKIDSSSGKTGIDAYSSKSQLRKLGNAIAGDYIAIGNSLMIDEDYWGARQTWLPESTTNSLDVATIPDDADVISAYLYWSGFDYSTQLFTDSCSNFDNWHREPPVTYTAVPVSDNDTRGTWSTAPYWDDVDEVSANDTDYFTGVATSSVNPKDAYQLFAFNSFGVPSGSAVTGLTVYVRARDSGNVTGGNNFRPSIKVNGALYNTTSTSIDPTAGFITYSYEYTVNPATNQAWTVADINGTGTRPLQQFGVYSDDLAPDIDISMIYAQVTVHPWSIYNGQFQGRGGTATVAQKTLTLKDPVNLSSYNLRTIGVTWSQSKSGTLESPDTLYYAMSGDNGTTWSTDIEAFRSISTAGTFGMVVPEEYMTGLFKIRFYFNFEDLAEYIRLDDISVVYMPQDTAAAFKINGDQVYFDADGEPQIGGATDYIDASYAASLPAIAGTGDPGHFFACYKDVSKLVKKYPVVEGEEHHPGNAEYTVGQVSAEVGEQVSYAGWSLIIIYGSPETAGHYLYLRDIRDLFAFNPGNTDLDFDSNGQPGGEVTNFIIPEPIKNKSGVIMETVAAKITMFVGEGDDHLSGTIDETDCIKITGQQSKEYMFMSNSASPDYNVWNGASPGMSYPGVDVDTFEILWEDKIFTPADSRVTLDLYSGQDAWNLIYLILSVRSETVTSGTGHYTIAPD